MSFTRFTLVTCVLGCAGGQLDARDSAVVSDEQPFAKQLLQDMIPKILLLEYNNVKTAEGYQFNYKTSDGTYREEVGIIMNPDTEQEELVVMGAFSYTDGNIETTTMYTADKKGYIPRVVIKKKIRESLVG